MYTSKDFNDNDLSFEENITNSYEVEDHIRQNNPLTIEHLKDYLDKNKKSSTMWMWASVTRKAIRHLAPVSTFCLVCVILPDKSWLTYPLWGACLFEVTYS